jgi:hypothetical protein
MTYVLKAYTRYGLLQACELHCYGKDVMCEALRSHPYQAALLQSRDANMVMKQTRASQ